jgi:hypothetical protein
MFLLIAIHIIFTSVNNFVQKKINLSEIVSFGCIYPIQYVTDFIEWHIIICMYTQIIKLLILVENLTKCLVMFYLYIFNIKCVFIYIIFVIKPEL